MTTRESSLALLASTLLLDSPPEPAFDRLTRLAARFLNAPAALVSLVDRDRQFFKSAVGLKEPWATLRETPLTHSFCRHVVEARAPLVVSDAREDPRVRDNLAIRDLDVIAYAGVPLIVGDEAIGALCVIDGQPRPWTEDDLHVLASLASSVVSEIELRMALVAARDDRALLDAVLESIGDGVLAIDSKRRFIIANAAARRVFAEGAEVGLPLPLDWAAKHRSVRPDGSPLPSEEGALARGLRGQPTNGLEFVLQRSEADPSTWVEVTGRPVCSADGRVLAAVAVYRDVTERKKRNDLYAALVGNLPNAEVVLFDHGLRCVALDGGMVRDRSFDAAAAIGKPLRDLTRAPAGPAFDRVEEAFRRTLAGESVSLEFVDGETMLSLHTAPVPDGRGGVANGVVLAQDITEHRRTELALHRRQQLYRAIVQHMPNGAVFMLDRDLRFLTADGPALASIMSEALVPADDIVGRTVGEVVTAENRGAIEATYRETFLGRSRTFEVRRSDRFFEISTEPIYEPETREIATILVFCYDVTERRRAHDANVSLLHEIHHRVKNNLQMVSSLLNLQARQVRNDEARAALLDAHARVRSISLLHESLYRSSDLGHINMRAYLQQLIDAMRRAFVGGDAPVAFTLDAEAIELPVSEALSCGLIVHELVANSMKHAFVGATHGPGKAISVGLCRRDDGLALSVKDNGVGFTVEPSENAETLGVNLVRDMSKQLHGNVVFEHGNGARVTVRFPVPSTDTGAP